MIAIRCASASIVSAMSVCAAGVCVSVYTHIHACTHTLYTVQYVSVRTCVHCTLYTEQCVSARMCVYII